MLICNEILRTSSLKISFYTDRSCQRLIPVHVHMISLEHIHLLEGIFRILLDFSLDVCLLGCHYLVDNHFQKRVGECFSITQLNGFWNMEISSALALALALQGLKTFNTIDWTIVWALKIHPLPLCVGWTSSFMFQFFDGTGSVQCSLTFWFKQPELLSK